MDPDPAIFFIELHDANKNLFFLLLIYFLSYNYSPIAICNNSLSRNTYTVVVLIALKRANRFYRNLGNISAKNQNPQNTSCIRTEEKGPGGAALISK
jgi:hypothetical protein